MKRHELFMELIFGWIDAESGYGAGRHKSPEIKAFFEGWMGETTPNAVSLNHLLSYSQTEKDKAREQLSAFANRLEDLALAIRAAVSQAEEKP